MWYGNDQSLLWTKNIISRVTSKPPERVSTALSWLQKQRFINTHRGEYIVTCDGREYYEAAKKNPLGMIKSSDVFNFKMEALTGLVEYRSKVNRLRISGQSTITRGVLPTTQPEPEHHVTPEDKLSAYQNQRRQLKRISKQLGITTEQFDEYWQADRIRICSGGGEAHFGLFDQGKNVCKRCLKKRGRK